MQQSLGHHITQLEQLIKALDDHLAEPGISEPERVRFIAELRTAQLALLHYRQAYALESAVA